MDRPLRVSDLVKTHFCPVRFFLEKDEPVQEPGRYSVCKQLAYHLGSPLDTERIWDEVTGVNPEIDPDLRQFLEECIIACSAHPGWSIPAQNDVPVRSEKYGIVGQVDKLYDAPVSFAIVRCTAAPDIGAYPQDRLRIAAYHVCIQETLGRNIEGGCIEYLPSGITRYFRPQPRDRRALMTAIRSARRILDGEEPEKPVDAARCTRCPHEHDCVSGSRASRLSRFFP
ncbi:MAG: Dna2/Cas4 domain-containing protein [Methanoregulaceae archaeon]